jgi:hypothetical protein
MASDLVQIQRYFGAEHVTFISLTPANRAIAKRFVKQHSIEWSTGWGAGELIERCIGRQYPILVVIGRDGRVFWNDGAARSLHKPDEAAQELFEQIKRALAMSTAAQTT